MKKNNIIILFCIVIFIIFVIKKFDIIPYLTLNKHERQVLNTELSNLEDAYAFLEPFVEKTRKDITLDTIKKFHWHVYKNLLYKTLNIPIAGQLRNQNYKKNPGFADYKDIPKLMDEFIFWLHNTDEKDIKKLAADVHLKIVSIHPFFDGNGRTARAFMNLILLQNGLPTLVIKPGEKEKYVQITENARILGKKNDFYNFIFARIK